MRYTMFLASLAMISCSGDTQKVSTSDDDDAGDDDDNGDDDDTTTDSATPVSEFFDPVAVGFEFTGGVLSDGSLSGFRYPGDPATTGQEYAPYILLTFASEAYFGLEADLQGPESCIVYSFLDPAPVISQPNIPITPFDTGDPLIYSYEFALPIDSANSNCFDDSEGGKLDPALWGPGGTVDLLESFNGARLGMGFAPLSQYILDGLGEETVADTEFMDSLFSEYIALNDKDGVWTGVDWSLGILFDWNETTHEALVNPDNTLVLKARGGAFPTGYVQSDAFWYQDFPLLDFANLKDGAP